MPIFNLFSKRQKKLRGEIQDVYVYDSIPHSLRIQIIHIINDTIGTDAYLDNAERTYEVIHKALCKEYGVFRLGEDHEQTNKDYVFNFLLKTQDFEKAVDVIELTFQHINTILRDNYYLHKHYVNTSTSPDQAIEELNHRFKEHSIGYQFEAGEIIRMDSTYVHSEIAKPTLNLIQNKRFAGANDEYLKAHEHYRNGRNKECLTECLKAFESTMKIICKEKRWSFNPTDTSKKLIQICFQNNLVPMYTQNQFTSLQNLIESGIPTIRNKLSGHGQGQVPQTVDDKITRYGLNLTGTNIIFLIEQSGL